jgi:hypothetical protein
VGELSYSKSHGGAPRLEVADVDLCRWSAVGLLPLLHLRCRIGDHLVVVQERIRHSRDLLWVRPFSEVFRVRRHLARHLLRSTVVDILRRLDSVGLRFRTLPARNLLREESRAKLGLLLAVPLDEMLVLRVGAHLFRLLVVLFEHFAWWLLVVAGCWWARGINIPKFILYFNLFQKKAFIDFQTTNYVS